VDIYTVRDLLHPQYCFLGDLKPKGPDLSAPGLMAVGMGFGKTIHISQLLVRLSWPYKALC
jgi:hypothetical protein